MVSSHQTMEQFCWNGVTGAIRTLSIATDLMPPARAWKGVCWQASSCVGGNETASSALHPRPDRPARLPREPRSPRSPRPPARSRPAPTWWSTPPPARRCWSAMPAPSGIPASLTKMMTIYIVFEELKAGRLTLATPMSLSEVARGQAALQARPGGRARPSPSSRACRRWWRARPTTWRRRFGELISGSEAAFAQRMTETAARIGMNGHPVPQRQRLARSRAAHHGARHGACWRWRW